MTQVAEPDEPTALTVPQVSDEIVTIPVIAREVDREDPLNEATIIAA
jgi:hypothetical protein